jgi:general secretion pathway protein D
MKWFGSRVLASLVLALCSLVSFSLAQGAELQKVAARFDFQTSTLTIQAAKQLRYRLDGLQKQITVLDAVFDESQRYLLPDTSVLQLVQKPTQIEIQFSYSIVPSVSEDNKTIIIRAQTSLAGSNTATQDERFPLILPLANADPQFVAGILTRSYNFKVEVDPRQRSLMIFAPRADWEFIRTVVISMDVPRPQVAFEAEILEINDLFSQDLGIKYSDLFSFSLKEDNPPGILDLGDITRAPLNVKIGLDLLKTTGVATTLARPRVTTLDGVEARLNSTQTVSTTVPAANGGQTLVTTTTGITLRLLPKVSPNGDIEASLSVAVSAPNNKNSFSTREANTTVRVRNGEPIVIGGLLENQNSTSVEGIPGLMDIPLLGELFKSTSTKTRVTELVIVVTPYLILPRTNDAPVAPPPAPAPGER